MPASLIFFTSNRSSSLILEGFIASLATIGAALFDKINL